MTIRKLNAHPQSLQILYKPSYSEDFREKGTCRTYLFDQNHPQMQIPREPHHLYDLNYPEFIQHTSFQQLKLQIRLTIKVVLSLTGIAYEKLKSVFDHERTSDSYKKPVLPSSLCLTFCKVRE